MYCIYMYACGLVQDCDIFIADALEISVLY